MPRLLSLLATLLLLAGCGFAWRGGGAGLPLPAYPGSTHLGQQRVYGADGTHLTWDAFATPDPPERVVEFYRTAVARAFGAGEDRFEPHGSGGGVWRFLREGEGGVVLDVLPAAEPGPHTGFADRMPGSARTVVIVARRR